MNTSTGITPPPPVTTPVSPPPAPGTSDATSTGTSLDVPNPGESVTSIRHDRTGPPFLNASLCQSASPTHQRVAWSM